MGSKEEEVRNGVRGERLIVLSQIWFYYKHISANTTIPHLPVSDIVGGAPTLTVLIPVECSPTSNKKFKREKIIDKEKRKGKFRSCPVPPSISRLKSFLALSPSSITKRPRAPKCYSLLGMLQLQNCLVCWCLKDHSPVGRTSSLNKRILESTPGKSQSSNGNQHLWVERRK